MHENAPRLGIPSPLRGRQLAMLVSGLLALAASMVPSAATLAARVPRTVFFEKFGYLE